MRWLLDFPRIVPRDARVFRLAKSGDTEGIKASFSAGVAAAKDTTVDGMTLLHIAAKRRNLGLMRFLIEQGADVNAAEESGESPLHAALAFGDNHEAVRLLIANGADLANRTSDKKTALHTIYNNTVAHVLMTCDWIEATVADADDMSIGHFIARSSQSTVSDFQRARAHDLGNLWATDRSGRTCLHFAASRGNCSLLEYLLERATPHDVRKADSQGLTPMHYAVRSSRAAKVIQLLLAHGGNILIKDHSDHNILHHAARWHVLGAIKQMLELDVENTFLTPDKYEQLLSDYMSEDSKSTMGESLPRVNPVGSEASKPTNNASIHSNKEAFNVVNEYTKRLKITLHNQSQHIYFQQPTNLSGGPATHGYSPSGINNRSAIPACSVSLTNPNSIESESRVLQRSGYPKTSDIFET
ncbi:MAG: hypothetical protein LQ352_003666 [Teloschistes flavicans]|nr:MAG: hypothetical protein LQ352_003666 [Teloschistes flavicans]